MTTITPKSYTICDFCLKEIDDEISINNWKPYLQHNSAKYDLCSQCDKDIRKAIKEVKEKRFLQEKKTME